MPRASLLCSAASRRVAQHSKQAAHPEQRKHSAARSSTDRPTLEGLCCKLLLSALLSVQWSLLYGALRELRRTLATSLPRYLRYSTSPSPPPLFRRLLSLASTPPYQAQTAPTQISPHPLPPPSLPPRYFLAFCVIPLFACAPPPPQSILLSAIPAPAPTALSLTPCLINH